MTNILFSVPFDLQKLYLTELSTRDLCGAAIVSKPFHRLVQSVVQDQLKEMIQFWEASFIDGRQTLAQLILKKLKFIETKTVCTRQLMFVLRLSTLILDCIKDKPLLPAIRWPKLIKEMRSALKPGEKKLVWREFERIGVLGTQIRIQSVAKFNVVALANASTYRHFTMDLGIFYYDLSGRLLVDYFPPSCHLSYSKMFERCFQGTLPRQKPGPYLTLEEAEERLKLEHPRPEAEEPPSKSLKLNLKNEKL